MFSRSTKRHQKWRRIWSCLVEVPKATKSDVELGSPLVKEFYQNILNILKDNLSLQKLLVIITLIYTYIAFTKIPKN